jgi:hypothetical protein
MEDITAGQWFWIVGWSVNGVLLLLVSSIFGLYKYGSKLRVRADQDRKFALTILITSAGAFLFGCCDILDRTVTIWNAGAIVIAALIFSMFLADIKSQIKEMLSERGRGKIVAQDHMHAP